MLRLNFKARPLSAFLLKRRLGIEQFVVWLGVGLFAIYLVVISPAYQDAVDGRTLVFNPIPWLLAPFLFTETDFDRQGWLRLFLSARARRGPLFLANAAARCGQAVVNAVVLAAIVVLSTRPWTDLGAWGLAFGTIFGFGLYMAALGSFIGQFVRGRLAILVNYLCVFLLAYLSLKLPAESRVWADFVLIPGPLMGLESAQLWTGEASWRWVSAATSSVVWWFAAYQVFKSQTSMKE